MLRAVILDVDGTLILSNEAHARAWEEAYREYGYDVPRPQIQPLIGMGGDKLMARLTPDLNEGEGIGKEITELRKNIFMERYLPDVKPAPGSRALVMRMRDDGLTIGIASSAKGDELQDLLRAADVDDLIQEATTSSDADQSKPAPDIVHAALQQVKTEPSQVLMIGDTPYDVESARQAGVGTIAVRCGGHDDAEMNDALAIYDDPADLLAHYDESPLGHRIGSTPASP